MTIIELFTTPFLTLFGTTLSNLEVFGFLTGIWCVWLVVKKKVLNFPVSILNAALLFILFKDSRLFADAGLQIFFIVLSAIGWYQWANSKTTSNKDITVLQLSTTDRYIWAGLLSVATVALYFILTWAKGSVPLFDAFIGAASIVAQILLNRRYLENWIIWIVVDIVSIPVYAYKELYLISILYMVFLGLAISGYVAWNKSYLNSKIELRAA